MARQRQHRDVMSRREVADRLAVHPDSVTRMLPEGLGGCVVAWGGHGARMVFSRPLVERYVAARDCRRRHGAPCIRCDVTLEDAKFTAEHLAQTGHGVGGCAECRAPWLLDLDGRPIQHGAHL